MWRARTLDRSAIHAEHRAFDEFGRHDALWPAQAALLVAIALNFTLPERLTVGPTWLMPGVEAAGLVGLVAVSLYAPHRHSRRRRGFALAVIGLITATYLASLYLLVHYLLKGGRTGGHPLIIAGVVLWLTNVLLFAVWYWLFDRGGPLPPPGADVRPDFLFAQMTDEVRAVYPDWKPNFLDYLYLSLTNASAFSPTDTLPLSRWTKALMGTQSVAALITVGLIVARAVNILS
jgi:hypothetical protein